MAPFLLLRHMSCDDKAKTKLSCFVIANNLFASFELHGRFGVKIY